jgi:hypothetical protein
LEGVEGGVEAISLFKGVLVAVCAEDGDVDPLDCLLVDTGVDASTFLAGVFLLGVFAGVLGACFWGDLGACSW